MKDRTRIFFKELFLYLVIFLPLKIWYFFFDREEYKIFRKDKKTWVQYEIERREFIKEKTGVDVK